MPRSLKRARVTLVVRLAGFSLFLWVVLHSRHLTTPLAAQDPASRNVEAFRARAIAVTLLDRYPEAADDASRAALRKAIADYDRGWATIAQVNNDRPNLSAEQVRAGLAQGDELFEQSTDQIVALLNGLPILDVGNPAGASRAVSIPFERTALLLRRRTGESGLRFLIKQVDLSSSKPASIDVEDRGDFYCLLELAHPPEGVTQSEVHLSAGADPLAKIDLSVTVPARNPLQVKVVDAEGRPTEAAVGIYSAGKRLLVPPTALDFSAGGYYYRPVRYREGNHTRYWPGGEDYSRYFFVRGGLSIQLPVGSYRLLAAKGPEYLPIDQQITVSAHEPVSQTIVLRRWINMPARGWYSGDTHLHYARPTREANQQLWLWTQAVDLSISNILRMGDGEETYFEQYGFGRYGRFVRPRFALVPGQEDPRSGLMGHAIGLNLPRPVRNLERGYYLYGAVFDDAHREGGLAGYAHVNTYARSSGVYRDMTINVARNKADFVEICEFGEVDTEIYYDFLNLGFRLTAVGGSDVPWGGDAGDSRVYVYGGRPFNPDQWFDGIKKGHTFVTVGPMLEFTVSGRLPGDGIVARRGEQLKIRARAVVGSAIVPIGRLEVVVNGQVFRSASPTGNTALLEFDLSADRSMWIAARATGAHTTPIYVTVDNQRHWLENAVPALLDARLKTLDEIDKLIDQRGANIKPNRAPVWENADSFRRGEEQLRRDVREARTVYENLRTSLR